MTQDPVGFVVRYVIIAGLPLAIIVDLALLTLGDNWPLFWSSQHLEQLVVVLIAITPTFGSAVGYGLLRLAQRRSRAAEIERAFRE